MIEVDQLVKRFGAVTAVDGLTFAVRPGHVTGFLGPNGAGKTTTSRVLLGLARPDGGTPTINGARTPPSCGAPHRAPPLATPAEPTLRTATKGPPRPFPA